MKKLYVLLCFAAAYTLQAQNVNFGTSNQFKQAMKVSSVNGGIAYDSAGNNMKADANGDGEIQVTEALQVYGINIDTNPSMQGLTGLEYFTSVRDFTITNSGISTVNLQPLINLETVYVRGSTFASVTISGNTSVTDIDIQQTAMANINVTGLTALQHLNIAHNNIVNTIDLTGLGSLVTFDASYNGGITSVVFTGTDSLQDINLLFNNIYTLNLDGLQDTLTKLNLGDNHFTQFDTNGFTNLKILSLISNNVGTLDIQPLTNLEYLYADTNHITALNPQGLQHIIELSLNHNELSSLNVQGLTTLFSLGVNDNNLTTIDVHGLPALKFFYCNENQINIPLNLSALPKIEYFNCNDNLLTSLDVSEMPRLTSLICYNNQLSIINLRNGHYQGILEFQGNPALLYVCCDANEIDNVNNRLAAYGYTATQVNSLCEPSSMPVNVLNGTVHFYADPNNVTGVGTPVANTVVTRQAAERFTYTDQNGYYDFVVYGQETSPLALTLENPELFSYTPPTYTFDQEQGQTITADINVFPSIANAGNADLETLLVPEMPAMPGMEAHYRLIIKNKGNATAAGTVSLTYNNTFSQLVSTLPEAQQTQPGTLSWSFANLGPLQTYEASLVLQLNTPTDAIPLYAGNTLHYTATAVLNSGAEYHPADNIFNLAQIVVNSFDPNDITCLEGDMLPANDAGKYVHYTIRFENTGTANAANIVVTDIINATQFDINSFVPLTASHNFRANKTGEGIQFYFNNINLPFDDENNDGYVVFKIKTLESLTTWDMFDNTANIYFDFNDAIVTNTYYTMFGELAVKDFGSISHFTLSPNPADDILNINATNGALIQSVNVYNTLGQLVITQQNIGAGAAINVAALSKGTYMIRVLSDMGASVSKFIKK